MSDDIKKLLGKALPERLPPSTMTTDELEARGDGAARRRTWALSGAATLGVAVLATAALLLPNAFASADPSPDDAPIGGSKLELAPEPGSQPEHVLPELDPDELYMWDYNGEDPTTTPETDALTDAFWDEVFASYPDLQMFDFNELTMRDPSDLDIPGFGRDEFGLRAGQHSFPENESEMGRDTGFVTPVYSLGSRWYGPEIQLKLTDDSPVNDTFSVQLMPRGSFAEGTGDYPDHALNAPAVPYLASGCDDYSHDVDAAEDEHVSFDCDEFSGPGGEHVQAVSVTKTGGHVGPKVSFKSNTVVVTLANGNAVVINDELRSLSLYETDTPVSDDLADYEPTMDYDALTSLALALPPVVVK